MPLSENDQRVWRVASTGEQMRSLLKKQTPLNACLLLLALAVGCNSETATPKTTRDSQTTDALGVAQFADPGLQLAEISRPSVDATTLSVTNFAVAIARVGKARVGSASFSASGLADYVELQLCQGATCDVPVRSMVTRVNLRAVAAGRTTLKAKACVVPERAKSSNDVCGSSVSTEFQQPANEDLNIISLQQDRESLSREFDDIGKKIKATLVKFGTDSKMCIDRKQDAQRVGVMRNLVMNLAQVAEPLLTKAISGAKTSPAPTAKLTSDSVDENSVSYSLVEATVENSNNVTDATPDPEPPVADAASLAPMADALSAAKSRMSKFQEMNSSVQSVAKSIGFFKEAKPVPAVQHLTGAVLDLFNSQKQIEGAAPCLAELTAKGEMEALNRRLGDIKTRISKIDAQLKEGAK